jgi:hypothetical protein
VPKRNKAVILVSSRHHDEKTDLDSNKLEIILDYNMFNGIFDL